MGSRDFAYNFVLLTMEGFMVRHNGDGRGWRGFLMGMLCWLATRGRG